MKVHELKLDTKYFDEVKDGNKNFEIRKNDRGYQIGDVLELKAYVGQESAEDESLDVGYAWTEHLPEEGYDIWENCEEELADTFKVKVTLVITAEKYNEKCDFTDPTILENELDYKFGVRGTQKVLKEYFGTDRLPNDYVLMQVKVIKTKRDLFKEIYEKYGIQTTAAFHCDLNQEMSDEQYQKELETWKKLSEMDWSDLGDDEEDDF